MCVILAGGHGVKLWPLSRERQPKQFSHLMGENTLLGNTIDRLKPLFVTEDIYIVTLKEYVPLVRNIAPSLPEENILGEPFGRNTAAALTLALTIICEKHQNEECSIALLPSDHNIPNVREFQEQLNKAFLAAETLQAIVSMGIPPTRAETEYGYIQKDLREDIVPEELRKFGVYRIRAFAEKPDKDTAYRFLRSGDFLWNTGIYVAPATVFQQHVEQYIPEFSLLFNNLKKHIGKKDFEEILDTTYRQLRSISIDYGIMEKTPSAYVLECTFNWSDLGSWDEIYRLLMKDNDDNVLIGNVLALNTKGSYIQSSERLIALIDVEDLIVIESDNVLLICKRGSSERVRELVNAIRRKKMNPFL